MVVFQTLSASAVKSDHAQKLARSTGAEFQAIKQRLYLAWQGMSGQRPTHNERFGAVGLLVTILWLYLEILRLLAKLRSN